MFTTFAEFIRCLVEARFGFRYLWDVLVSTYYAMTENPHVQDAWEKIMSILSPIAIVVPYIIIVIGLIVAFTLKAQLKSVRRRYTAHEYVREGSVNIRRLGDFYLYRNVVRTKRQNNNKR